MEELTEALGSLSLDVEENSRRGSLDASREHREQQMASGNDQNIVVNLLDMAGAYHGIAKEIAKCCEIHEIIAVSKTCRRLRGSLTYMQQNGPWSFRTAFHGFASDMEAFRLHMYETKAIVYGRFVHSFFDRRDQELFLSMALDHTPAAQKFLEYLIHQEDYWVWTPGLVVQPPGLINTNSDSSVWMKDWSQMCVAKYDVGLRKERFISLSCTSDPGLTVFDARTSTVDSCMMTATHAWHQFPRLSFVNRCAYRLLPTPCELGDECVGNECPECGRYGVINIGTAFEPLPPNFEMFLLGLKSMSDSSAWVVEFEPITNAENPVPVSMGPFSRIREFLGIDNDL